MKYRIVENCDTKTFEYHVNKCIEEGWVPLGGVTVSINEYRRYRDSENMAASEVYYTQAMVKQG